MLLGQGQKADNVADPSLVLANDIPIALPLYSSAPFHSPIHIHPTSIHCLQTASRMIQIKSAM